MPNGLEIITMSILILILVPVVIGIFTAIFQWLWNITMPEVFGLRIIRFWQAFRLLIISSFIFGGIHYASNGNSNSTGISQSSSVSNQQLDSINTKLFAISGELRTISERLAIITSKIHQ